MLNSLKIESMSETKVRMMSATHLAYVGDAVFDFYVRTQILHRFSDWGIHEINRIKVGVVKASQQARLAKVLMEHLTESELSILKRGRNTKTQSVPKNALLSDYRYATGFESLIGYLVLSGQNERLSELLTLSWQTCDEDGLLMVKGRIK